METVDADLKKLREFIKTEGCDLDYFNQLARILAIEAKASSLEDSLKEACTTTAGFKSNVSAEGLRAQRFVMPEKYRPAKVWCVTRIIDGELGLGLLTEAGSAVFFRIVADELLLFIGDVATLTGR